MTAAKDQGPTSSDVERMREALEWYGEQARLARLIHSEGDAGRHALAEDGGKRARAILAERSAARSEPSTAGWLPISTAPKDGTRILTKLDHPVTPVQIARWQHLEWRLDNNNWPCYPLGWQPLPPPSQEGASEALGEPKASEHISPERRRGLEEAAKALADAADDVGVKFFDTDTMEPEVERMQKATLAIRALIPPSSEGGSPR
jgi:hypothetical protein